MAASLLWKNISFCGCNLEANSVRECCNTAESQKKEDQQNISFDPSAYSSESIFERLSPLFEEQRKEVNEAIEATRSEQEQRDKVQKDIRRQNWAILVGTVIIIILTAAGLAVALHW